jgi:glutamate/tyrosine decarboxylase-like PLP-dependent enzyme
LHVDACVGGFLAPFAKMNGAQIAPFDFEIAAVKSMSADLHKYGYAAKGASTVLYRSPELYAHMPFDTEDWSGARLVTPTLAGTRPGGAIAAAWAVMNFLGIEGYRAKQKIACDTRRRIQDALVALGFEILGDPQLALIAFRHDSYDAYALWGKLIERGWFTSITTEPPSLHLMISPFHERVADRYIEDLKASMVALDDGDRTPTPQARYN